ncbi:MAG: heavy-metal-associated domain-containing protein [Bacteroidota bacterium]
MKKRIITTLIIGILTMYVANAQKAMDKFMVQVDGLGCPFCAYGLEKKFKEFKGIKNVKIDIETGDFSFSYPAEKKLTMEAVTSQVEKAGYTPITSKIERSNGKIETSAKDASGLINNAALIEQETFVAGNCDQCRARIEKAAKNVPGVVAVSWNKDSKILTAKFDRGATSMSAIEKRVSKAGHDTKNFKAKDEVYKELPPCCYYERVAD